MATDAADEGLDLTGETTIRESRTRSEMIARLLGHGVLLLASIIAIFPFAFAFVTSLKQPGQVFAVVASFGDLFPADPTFANYVLVWTEQPLDRWFFNSLIVAVGVVWTTLVLDTLVGYALAKGEFRGRDYLFLVVVGLLVIPPQAVLVPLFIEMQQLGWTNTYWGILAPFLASPFGAFYMRQYFQSIPDSLLESARIDGCSQLQILTRIMLPMSKPALSSLAVFQFIFAWGAFLWPLVVTGKDSMFVLQVGLAFLTGRYSQNAFGQLLAATMLAALPVLVAYLLAQRTFIEGIALTGAKGA